MVKATCTLHKIHKAPKQGDVFIKQGDVFIKQGIKPWDDAMRPLKAPSKKTWSTSYVHKGVELTNLCPHRNHPIKTCPHATSKGPFKDDLQRGVVPQDCPPCNFNKGFFNKYLSILKFLKKTWGRLQRMRGTSQTMPTNILLRMSICQQVTSKGPLKRLLQQKMSTSH